MLTWKGAVMNACREELGFLRRGHVALRDCVDSRPGLSIACGIGASRAFATVWCFKLAYLCLEVLHGIVEAKLGDRRGAMTAMESRIFWRYLAQRHID